MKDGEAHNDATKQSTDAAGEQVQADDTQISRLRLILDVLIFQLKLTVDGLRDVLLVPVSLVAGLMGLLAGGKDPARFYNEVLGFGRKTEEWINLFGYRDRSGTSDELVDPIRDTVMREARENPLLRAAGDTFNRSLDKVGEAIAAEDEKKKGDR